MSQIKNKNTKPEILVRKFLFANGFRYRLHCKDMPGKPDMILPKYKTAIFINGCFWHGHTNCKYAVIPATNTEFWETKIKGNMARDKKTYCLLSSSGWNVIVVWQCELKSQNINNTLENLIRKIKYNEQR